MAGPCCFSSNVQAAKVLGILLVVLNLLYCLGTDEYGHRTTNVVYGILGALISGILVFGAIKRNSKAILVWIILAIIECIALAVEAALLVIGLSLSNETIAEVSEVPLKDVSAVKAGMVFFLLFCIGGIFFTIWTIIVAKNARKEIQNGQ